jgi:hypothetical protein
MHSFEFVIEALTTNGFLRITPRGELWTPGVTLAATQTIIFPCRC